MITGINAFWGYCLGEAKPVSHWVVSLSVHVQQNTHILVCLVCLNNALNECQAILINFS